MEKKPGYEELEQRIKELEQEVRELKRAKKELREIKERYQGIASSIPGVVYQFLLKKDGSYSSPYISESASSILDISAQEVMANPYSIFDRILKEDLDSVNQSIAESARNMKTWLQEFRIRTRAGDIKWIRGTSIPHLLADGEILWNGVLLDISDRVQAEEALQKAHKELEHRVEERTAELMKATERLRQEVEERKQAEEALRESEERYRSLVENSLSAIILYRQDEILFANNPFFDIFGYKRVELQNLVVDDLLAPGVVAEVAELRRRRLDGKIEQTSIYESKGKRKGGYIFDMEISVCVVSFKGERCCMAFLSDISKRKRIEEELQESNQKYKILTDSSLTGIFIHQDDKYVFVNDTFAKMHGYKPKELLGKAHFELIHPDQREMIKQRAYKRLKGEKVPQRYEIKRLRKDGKAIWHEIIVSEPINYRGKPAIMGHEIDLTERKQAEEALRESEKHFRLLFNRVFDALVMIDEKGQVADVNEAACRLVGYTKEELLKLSVGDIHPDEEMEKIQLAVSRVLRDGIDYMGETAFRTKDGRIIPVEAGGVALKVAGKIYTLGSFRDIAERKQAEEALRESEQRYSALFDRSLDCVYLHDLQGNFIDANPTALELFGYTVEEIPSFNFSSLLSEDQIPTALQALEEIINTGSQKELIEYKLKRKDGKYVYLETKGSLIYCDGKPYAVQGVARDITMRKRAEQTLKESEERFREMATLLPTIVSEIDMNFRLTYVNQAAFNTFGYSQEDFEAGLRVIDMIHPDDRERAIKKMIKVIKEEGQGENEYRMFSKDGSELNFFVLSRPIYKEGKVVGLRSTHTNITEKKKLEAQLRRAHKMEAIGTLAGGVAHDLNNVLAGLVSYPDLLLMELPDNSPLRKPILTIQKSGEKAAAIVQDLLTLARRGVAVTEVVNLNIIISEYVKSPEYEKLISFYPNVHVRTELDSDLLHVLGSPTHLSKTVMNLVSNAAEAMPDGGTISISTENRYIDKPVRGYDHVKEGDYVILTVSDAGVGITPEDMDRIFEPFYTKKAMGRSGTGLGMAVVWGTVKDHKGYIDAQSIEGKGTTFTLYFPVTREMAKDKTLLSIEDYMGKGESILVVDDVEEQREIASRILNKLGYSVAAVSSGEEAVEYMENNSADLLLLDMIMDPGIDGLETYKRIIEFHPGQKAIITSGFSETDRVKGTQRLGAGVYLKKPFLLEKIGTAVREELER
jgi:PAS domain S-box-containing protein